MPLHVSNTVVIIIRRSKLYYTASDINTPVGGVFYTLPVNFCPSHISFIAFCLVISAIIITYVIRQCHCYNTLSKLCITVVQAIQEAASNLTSRC